jgi:undecaprenyldiphospho-muramoylpentapeptide beta-N-acetylglucosaminyltransferase
VTLSVVLAGGGSAGHVSPLLALADALVRAEEQTRITVLGTAEGLEARLVPDRGYLLRTIAKVPLPRRMSVQMLALPGRLAVGAGAARGILRAAQADVVVGMGGYVSPPAYVAARSSGIPIVVHEQNARAGIANRLGARLTTHVATAFDGTGLPHARRIGMPMRREITSLRADLTGPDAHQARATARHLLGLQPELPTLLVTGGSLGAQRINEAMAGVLDELVANPWFQVLHLTGAGKADPIRSAVRRAGAEGCYHVREYLDEIHQAYAAADLVLCRSGANTVCELACLGLPAIYVPLPIGNGEQRLNASAVVAAGGGLLVDNDVLDAAYLREVVLDLLAAPKRLRAMSSAAAGHGIGDADQRLSDMVRAAAGAQP